MRLKARVDANQAEITEAFRKAGCSVLPLHQIGSGCPDLLVSKNRKSALIEIKDGSKPPSRQALTDDEQLFIDSWRGEVYVVRSVDEAWLVARMM